MPRIARNKFKTGFFHIIIQGINKEYIFQDNGDKENFIYLMKKYYIDYKINLVAYCVMDNHAHFIIYTENIREISNYMHRINSIYAMYYNNKLNRVGYVFRNRYNSQYIDNEEYLLKCIKYIHMNPVKANIVEKENQYKYSSYNDFIYGKEFIVKPVVDEILKNKYKKIDEIDVKMMDIDNDNENFENAITKYLNINKLNLNNINQDKKEILKLSLVLISKGYNQKQIAKRLNISSSKISRILKE